MANKRPVTHFQTSRDLFILDTNEATACYYATLIGEIYRPTSLILKPKTWPTVQTLTTTFCPDYIWALELAGGIKLVYQCYGNPLHNVLS